MSRPDVAKLDELVAALEEGAGAYAEQLDATLEADQRIARAQWAAR